MFRTGILLAVLAGILVAAGGLIGGQQGAALAQAGDNAGAIDLGLSSHDSKEGRVPAGWSLRKRFGSQKGAKAEWVIEDGLPSVKLYSKAALAFLEKKVDIDIREHPIVTWRWKVQNILSGIDE